MALVTVHNDGWYVAEFWVTYWDIFGTPRMHGSGHITLGRSASLAAPADLIVRIHAREWTGFGWKTIFVEDFLHGVPYNICARVWGTTLDPQWGGC